VENNKIKIMQHQSSRTTGQKAKSVDAVE